MFQKERKMCMRMKSLLFWVLIGASIGVFLNVVHAQLPKSIEIGIIILIVMGIGCYHMYILFWTKNVNLVEGYVKKRIKHPYYALTRALVHKQFEQAEQYAEQLKKGYEEAKKLALVHIYIEKGELEEAERVANDIQNETARYYNQALIALLRGQEDRFENLKQKVKKHPFCYVLEAERAFRNGDQKEAERYGNLAISTSRGLQRYVLVRSLEHQQNHPNRQTFF